MELRDYVSQEMKRLTQFEAWWIVNNKTKPDIFPMELNEGDWDEQVSFFAEKK